MQDYGVTVDDVRAAAERIDGIAHRTPVGSCKSLDRLAGRKLIFKCEQWQKVGAFKFRGAYNFISQLGPEVSDVVTHSSGNHAQAVALAARLTGKTAHIVMPRTAPGVKRRAVASYGGRITLCEPVLEARETAAAEIASRTGAVLVPPYDHPWIIAGQGTVALELLEQAPEVAAIIAPVGGGGLISGIAIAAKAIKSEVRIIAAEPKGADDAYRSLRAGRLIPQTQPNTIADGLLTSLGQWTWPILRDHVERVVCVSDVEIVAAMRLLWERAKWVVEPSAAVPLAAVLSEELRQVELSGPIGIVLSGGNVDLDRLPW